MAGTRVGALGRGPAYLQDCCWLPVSFPLPLTPHSHPRRVYKERLGLSTKTIIGYQAHADTATKSNILAKNKFVV